MPLFKEKVVKPGSRKEILERLKPFGVTRKDAKILLGKDDQGALQEIDKSNILQLKQLDDIGKTLTDYSSNSNPASVKEEYITIIAKWNQSATLFLKYILNNKQGLPVDHRMQMFTWLNEISGLSEQDIALKALNGYINKFRSTLKMIIINGNHYQED